MSNFKSALSCVHEALIEGFPPHSSHLLTLIQTIGSVKLCALFMNVDETKLSSALHSGKSIPEEYLSGILNYLAINNVR